MTKESVMELKNEIYQQLQLFEIKLLDLNSVDNDKLKKLEGKIHKLVDGFVKQGGEDLDLWVFLKYRDGKVLSKNSKVVKVEPVTLRDAIDKGFAIPETTTMVEFEIKPVWENGYNRYVEDQNIYEIKFGLNNGEELTPEQFKRRYKLTVNDNLYSVDDLKQHGRILKFSSTKKKAKQRVSVRVDESELSL